MPLETRSTGPYRFSIETLFPEIYVKGAFVTFITMAAWQRMLPQQQSPCDDPPDECDAEGTNPLGAVFSK